jgi:hypothetical protein
MNYVSPEMALGEWMRRAKGEFSKPKRNLEGTRK